MGLVTVATWTDYAVMVIALIAAGYCLSLSRRLLLFMMLPVSLILIRIAGDVLAQTGSGPRFLQDYLAQVGIVPGVAVILTAIWLMIDRLNNRDQPEAGRRRANLLAASKTPRLLVISTTILSGGLGIAYVGVYGLTGDRVAWTNLGALMVGTALMIVNYALLSSRTYQALSLEYRSWGYPTV